MQYEYSDGYLLGQPFLRAFTTILDFPNNSIGIANRPNNYGASIIGEYAPGPLRPYYIANEDKETNDRDIVLVNPSGRTKHTICPKPIDHPKDRPPNKNHLKLKFLIIIWLIVLIIAGIFCHRYNKKK